ncbi:MAG: class I SAM-dependent methyltransferase [Candidatus Merdivicinus sp.]|jgi:cyclopropane fatty-acyl-phospholipid synthase-like methyltransferase
MKDERLFYQAYESFYQMAEDSVAFSQYCTAAFGEDFSQDGFGDCSQLRFFFEKAPVFPGAKVLDIGCGNGKLLAFLQREFGAEGYGFDYSRNAIHSARQRLSQPENFQVFTMEEADYPSASFDRITSLDSIYFAQDMEALVRRIYGWLKPGGFFLCAYQEGDVMPKTLDFSTTALAQAFRNIRLPYSVWDITDLSYQTLIRKRQVILAMRENFAREGRQDWFDLILHQTDPALLPYEEYQKQNARYFYLLEKAKAD